MYHDCLWFPEVIGWLMTHEIERVREETDGDESAMNQARTYFKPLSDAKFGAVTTLAKKSTDGVKSKKKSGGSKKKTTDSSGGAKAKNPKKA